jgi:hypothetical protein
MYPLSSAKLLTKMIVMFLKATHKSGLRLKVRVNIRLESAHELSGTSNYGAYLYQQNI